MPKPPAFEISNSQNGSGVTVHVTGELDMSTVQTLSDHLEGHLSAGVSELALDLRNVSFMDSSGLRFLIELTDRCQSASKRLKLIRPEHEAAMQVLRATGADAALPFGNGDTA